MWEKLFKRNFRSAVVNTPTDESWRECYQRTVRENETKLKQLSSKIVEHQRAITAPIRTTKLADAKTPREIRRRQQLNGTALPIGRELPTAQEISTARRQIFETGSNESLRKLPNAIRQPIGNDVTRGRTSGGGGGVTKKPALMLKTLRMLKSGRR